MHTPASKEKEILEWGFSNVQSSALVFYPTVSSCPRKTSGRGIRIGEVAERSLQGRLATDVQTKGCKDNPKFWTEVQKLLDPLLYILVMSPMVGKQRSAQAQ